jgi:alpha-tubulin suppressor-like RCC1 family protein
VVYGWGDNQSGELGRITTAIVQPTPVLVGAAPMVAVSAGLNFGLGLDHTGAVWAWGLNDVGQLGPDGPNQPGGCPVDPVDNACTNTPVKVKPLQNVVAIAAGLDFSMALKGDGSVWAWGDDDDGELGPNGLPPGTPCPAVNDTDRDVEQIPGYCNAQPVVVTGLKKVVAIANGGDFGLALENDGSVWAWGSNMWGQLGPNGPLGLGGCPKDPNKIFTVCSSTPVQVAGLSPVTAIAARRGTALAIEREGGTVMAWGSGARAELGPLGPTGGNKCRGNQGLCSIVPQTVGISHAVAIAEGAFFGLALRNDGSVWAWGLNNHGELGPNGTKVPGGCPGVIVLPVGSICSPDPVPVQGLQNVTAIAGGYQFGMAIVGKRVFSWGGDGQGQLGRGSVLPTFDPQPQLVVGPNSNSLAPVIAIAAGDGYYQTFYDNSYPHALAITT